MDRESWLYLLLTFLFVQAGFLLLRIVAKGFEWATPRADDALRRLIEGTVRRVVKGVRSLFP